MKANLATEVKVSHLLQGLAELSLTSQLSYGIFRLWRQLVLRMKDRKITDPNYFLHYIFFASKDYSNEPLVFIGQ
jgi:hypothetical protein